MLPIKSTGISQGGSSLHEMAWKVPPAKEELNVSAFAGRRPRAWGSCHPSPTGRTFFSPDNTLRCHVAIGAALLIVAVITVHEKPRRDPSKAGA